jgi:hypothetical protein
MQFLEHIFYKLLSHQNVRGVLLVDVTIVTWFLKRLLSSIEVNGIIRVTPQNSQPETEQRN